MPTLFRFGSSGRFAATLSGLCTIALMGLAPANAASGIEGHWKGPNGGVIAFDESCNGLCGRVVTAPDGNAAPGTQITQGLAANGLNAWRGKFYIAPRDTWIDADLTLKNADTLQMNACMMGGLVCRERELKRVAQ